MYYYNYHGSGIEEMAGAAMAFGIGAFCIMLVLGICFIVAYFMTISSLVKTARAKGCPFGSGKLWFIGIFTTPIVLGVLVAAQPDRGRQTNGDALPPSGN